MNFFRWCSFFVLLVFSMGCQSVLAEMQGDHAGMSVSDNPRSPVEASEFARKDALAISQSAIGREVGYFRLYDTRGQAVSLQDYRGKPLVISLIYTSCYHICPTTTNYLYQSVDKALDVLGQKAFNVVTIGFDSENDTPDSMQHYAHQRGLDTANWSFLSTDKDSMAGLAKELGFLYFASPRGFDHLIQTTILDSNGVVFRQVYGNDFELPHLIEPLKVLVFGGSSDLSVLDSLSSRIKLFCTVYDPATGKYKFSYAIFVGLAIGLTMGGAMIIILIREWRRSLSSQ